MGERTHLSHEIKKLRSNQKQVNVKDDPVNSVSFDSSPNLQAGIKSAPPNS